MDVAFANELLETFPVLSGEVGSERTNFGDFVLLELLVEVSLSVLFTTFGNASVELNTTFWRCVRRNVEFFNFKLFVCLSILEGLVKSSELVAAKFALANVCLVDEELDVGSHLVLDDALEFVVTNSRSNGSSIGEGRSGDDAVSHLHARQCVSLAALCNVECKFEVAGNHLWSVFVGNWQSCCTTIVVRYYGVVATYFFTLQSERSAWSFFVAIYQVRSYGYFGILNKEFGRDVCSYSCRNQFA